MSSLSFVHSSESAETAIPRLLEKHGGLIYRLGREFCGNHEGAEDLVQETFIRAFRNWSQFEGRSNTATWLYTIAVRTCKRLKHQRSGEPRHLQSLSELLPSPHDDIPDFPHTGEGSLDEIVRQEAQDAVHGAIAKLPSHFRLALVLKDIVEFSTAEVAQILGLKEATVKTRVHRARLLLRKELSQQLPKRKAPPPDHARRVCLDLLYTKQEALDRGAAFPLAEGELCSRCRALFTTLDLARDACREIRQDTLPDLLKDILLKEFGSPS